MARTRKTVEDRRVQIMDAALQVFARKGYTRATNQDIAREACITTGLIYHYFPSKEALLEAILQSRAPLQWMLSLPTELNQQPPETALHALLKQLLVSAEERGFIQLIRAYLPEVVHNPNVAPLGAAIVQQEGKILENYLAAKVESGELRNSNVSLATQLILGSLIAIVLRRQVLRDPEALQYSQDEIVDSLVNTFLRGSLPE